MGSNDLTKPVYECSIANEPYGITIEVCEVLVDSGNTACDLLLTATDASKLALVPSSLKQQVGGFTAGLNVFIVKMDPSLMVTFALEDAGVIVTKKAPVDAWVLESELSSLVTASVLPAAKRAKKTSRVPVNQPSPIKHLVHGSANLGYSGCKKLKLKLDFATDHISFLQTMGLPEI